MIEGFDNSTLMAAAGGVALTAVLVVGMAVWANRQRFTHDVEQITKLRRKRALDYKAASAEYKKFRKKIESGNTILIDLIHDLGDDFVGRDSAQQQIAFDEAFEAVASIRQANERTRIVVVLHTLGGYARPAHMIALALKHHIGKAKGHYNPRKAPRVIAYVPYVAMSGGTMIALAADQVGLDGTASLGPIDTVYGGFPTEAYKDLLEQKGALATQDVLVMLAHEAEKYDRYASKVAREIVNPAHRDGSRPEHFLADHLSSGTLSHSQAISPEEAKELGMNVTTKIPSEIYGLVDARIRMINTRLEHEDGEQGSDAPQPRDDPEGAEQVLEHAIRQSLRGGLRF